MRLVLVVLVSSSIAFAEPAKPAGYEKTYDGDHALPGLPGFSIKRVKDAGYCTGTAIVVKAGKAPVGEDKLVEVLVDVPPKMELDNFSANLQKRMAWSNAHAAKVDAVVKQYQAQMGTTDAKQKLAAAARIIELEFHGAIVTLHAEIPKGAVGEAQQLFCDNMAKEADRLLGGARSDVPICTDLAKTAPKGWWNEVCR